MYNTYTHAFVRNKDLYELHDYLSRKSGSMIDFAKVATSKKFRNKRKKKKIKK